jgi:hypothetical protein
MKLLPTVVCLAGMLGVMASTSPAPSTPPRVDVLRAPDGGLQPDVVVDAAGVLHLVYLTGPAGTADVFYTSSRDGGRSFATSVRVNSKPGSAVATGTIRGAQLALGRDGRVHVVWNGSGTAEPKPPVREGQKPGAPLLYARSAPGGATFEPQRNLITATRHLDGGSSVAADEAGHVFVAWHGNAIDGAEGEEARRVWLARSADDGRTFAAEVPISPAETGVCGCCGLRIAAAGGDVHVLYRAATRMVHRDVHALRSSDGGRTFVARKVDAWEIGACPMSSMAIVPGGDAMYGWEHDGNVAFLRGDGASVGPALPIRRTPARAASTRASRWVTTGLCSWPGRPARDGTRAALSGGSGLPTASPSGPSRGRRIYRSGVSPPSRP